ncbi:MAG: glycoside hydrolase [Opitutaceae bacterium]|nr:glycoside hydrolase [Opitutaceae bacterium]
MSPRRSHLLPLLAVWCALCAFLPRLHAGFPGQDFDNPPPLPATPAPSAPAPAAETFGITTLTPPRLDTNPNPAYWPRMRLWQGVPSIERAPAGRLWATWYSGGIGEGKGHNYQLLVTSADDGLTWSKPVAVFDPGRQLLGGAGSDAHLWLDPRGRLWWFIHRHMPAAPGIHPRTCWGFYTDTPDAPRPRWHGPLFAGYGYSLNKEFVTSDGEWLHLVDPMSRKTGGPPPARKGAHVWKFAGYDRPFEHLGHIEIKDTPFTEHMLVERKNGGLWMLARARYGIAQAVSDDKGRTWRETAPFTSDFNINTRFYLGKLKSGSLLLIVNDHPKKRENLTAMLSDDDGETWPHKLVLDERGYVSYPDATQSPDGFIYAIHDRGRYQKDMQEILFAKITEADIRAGRLVTEGGFLKRKINKLADEGGGVHFDGESFGLTRQYEQLTGQKPREPEPGEKAEMPPAPAPPPPLTGPAGFQPAPPPSCPPPH